MNLKKPVSIILGTVFLLTLAYGLGRYHAVTAIIPPFQVYFSPNVPTIEGIRAIVILPLRYLKVAVKDSVPINFWT